MSAVRLLLVLAVLAAPLVTDSQPAGKVHRIAILTYPSVISPRGAAFYDAFQESLGNLGWVHGQNVVVERRPTELERLPDLAAQLVRERVDLIVTDATPAARAAKNATTVIPILMAVSADPVAGGVVDRIAQPGGNVTGLTTIAPEVAGKRMELLRELVPGLRRVAAVYPPGVGTDPVVAQSLKGSETAAQRLGLEFQVAEVLGADRWDAAFAGLRRAGVGGVSLGGEPRYFVERQHIARAALKHGLATVSPFREQAEAGGLVSYGPNLLAMFRRAAALADKILRGTPPRTIPIEQPTTFDLLVNITTAKALGLTIPQSVLLRADEVIQ